MDIEQDQRILAPNKHQVSMGGISNFGGNAEKISEKNDNDVSENSKVDFDVDGVNEDEKSGNTQ